MVLLQYIITIWSYYNTSLQYGLTTVHHYKMDLLQFIITIWSYYNTSLKYGLTTIHHYNMVLIQYIITICSYYNTSLQYGLNTIHYYNMFLLQSKFFCRKSFLQRTCSRSQIISFLSVFYFYGVRINKCSKLICIFSISKSSPAVIRLNSNKKINFELSVLRPRLR